MKKGVILIKVWLVFVCFFKQFLHICSDFDVFAGVFFVYQLIGSLLIIIVTKRC